MLPDALPTKVLITGASGFIGTNLRRALLEAGVDVVAIRRPRSPEPTEGRSVVATYDDVDALARIVREEKPDVLYHVAGATKGVTYEDFQRANVMPTRNLLRAAADGHPGLGRFLHVSSVVAYGPSRPEEPHREDAPRRPIEHYGRSKLEAEEVVEAEERIPWTIVRPGGVYGPGDVDYFNLFREVERGRNLFFGNRRRWFSSIYVDDCVRGIVASAQGEATTGRGYFLCDPEPVTWEGFQRAIAAESGRPRVREVDLPEFLTGLAALGGELVTRMDGRPRLFNRQKVKMSSADAWTASGERAEEDFGFRPGVALREGVRRSFRWYRAAGWL